MKLQKLAKEHLMIEMYSYFEAVVGYMYDLQVHFIDTNDYVYILSENKHGCVFKEFYVHANNEEVNESLLIWLKENMEHCCVPESDPALDRLGIQYEYIEYEV